ncbi:MAG: RES family NAD+ phosphorylase [Rhodothermales bacterium]
MAMREAVRLTQRRYEETAYSGAGALRVDGRWHRAGLPLVYATESAAVALLEVLVHVERPRLLTMDLVVVPSRFDESLVLRVEDAYGPLPASWWRFPWPAPTQEIGRRWVEEQRSVVLDVPSAVVRSARNYVLNSAHPNFGDVEIDEPSAFEIDPRLGASG